MVKKIKVLSIIIALFVGVLGIGLKVHSSYLAKEKIAMQEELAEEIVENEITLETEQVIENNDEIIDIAEVQNEEIKEVEENKNSKPIQENKTEEKNIKTSSISQNAKVVEEKPKKVVTQETKLDNKNHLDSNEKNVKSNTTEVKIQENQVIIPKDENISSNSQEIKKADEEKINNEVVPVTRKEEYIRNDEMINKIKQIIQNNESEFMKMYGYEIIVDSSIKNKTSEFTFSESRVKTYLPNKFGTIRIYVEDYFKDGQLIMTECYIL